MSTYTLPSERKPMTKTKTPPPSLPLSPSSELLRSGAEWIDTRSLFSPSATTQWSDVPSPPPGTVALGVGYGDLVAYTSRDDVARTLARHAAGETWVYPDRSPRYRLVARVWQPD